jgi:Fe-S-cluster containining protein
MRSRSTGWNHYLIRSKEAFVSLLKHLHPHMNLIHTPDQLQASLANKAVENIFFKKRITSIPAAQLNPVVQQLNEKVSAAVDCTQCGNCCKKLEPGLEQDEIEVLAAQKGMEPEVFKREHIGYDGHSHFLNAKPCMFLKGTVCSIYENRPGSCAGYPHLDQQDAIRNPHIWSSYSMCPIVFNVVEGLKEHLQFEYP